MWTDTDIQELRKREARIAELACELRNELQELFVKVHEEWCKDDNEEYITPDGTELTDDEIDELADDVAKIEEMFFTE